MSALDQGVMDRHSDWTDDDVQSTSSDGAAVGASGSLAKPAEDCTLVVFGATGDLMARLLMPSLAHMGRDGLLPRRFALVGVGRSPVSNDDFRTSLDEALRSHAREDRDSERVKRLVASATYVTDGGDHDGTGDLAAAIEAADAPGNVVFYLATPPQAVEPTVSRLADAGLLDEERSDGWRRVIVEKPFGRDLASARALNASLLEHLREEQIFRIDHYLGKETVQNLMALRFANGMFEPLWNREHIDHVQITVAESLGVEERAGYYDRSGAMRDMVPNHLFQLLALVAMGPPNCFKPESVRTAKAQALEAVRWPTPAQAVRAQYVAGDGEGRDYLDENGVADGSTTETYCAMKLEIDNWRWAGTPFYLRTGKAMPGKRTEVAIQFRQAPMAIFQDTPLDQLTPNWMTIAIQPEESVSLAFSAKKEGPAMRMRPAEMRFAFDREARTTGYETLLYDCMNGDPTLFQRADFVEAGWTIVDGLLEAWNANDEGLETYAIGSDGPDGADRLLRDDGRRWRPLA